MAENDRHIPRQANRRAARLANLIACRVALDLSWKFTIATSFSIARLSFELSQSGLVLSALCLVPLRLAPLIGKRLQLVQQLCIAV